MKQRALATFAILAAFAMIVMACKGKKPPTGGGGNPTPGVSSTPTPSERYPGRPAACQSLTNGTGGGSCREHVSNYDSSFLFLNDVNAATTRVRNEHPEYFGADGETITNKDAYIRAVASALSDRGICAVFNGWELFVRDGRNVSEWYNLIWNGKARAFTLRACTPAGPMPEFYTSPPPNDPWCPLPNSSNDGGSCDGGTAWKSLVETMILEMVNEERPKGVTSQIYDFSLQRQGDGDYGYRIKDLVPYFNRLKEKAHQRNLCAYGTYFDTLMLKSPTGGNAYSEAFDIVMHLDGSGGLPAGAYGRSPNNGAKCSPPEF